MSVDEIGLAAAGLGLGSTIADIDAGIEAVVDAVESGLFTVDLTVFQQYYAKVYALYESLTQQVTGGEWISQARSAVAAAQSHAQNTTIAGLAYAYQTAAQTVSGEGSSASLYGAMQKVQSDLAQHLKALYNAYTAYIQTDATGAAHLTAASDPAATKVRVTLPSPATPSSGPADGSGVLI